MNIIKPGNLDFLKGTKKFECRNCGCVFEADKNEYSCGSQYNDVFYICDCPCCGSIAYHKEAREKTFENN